MKFPFFQVDAFVTGKPFSGNPAGVCILSGPMDETWMQNLALKVNLSETAYLHPENDGYRLRWFTPKTEVDLCGHATLASAHVLWQEGLLRSGDEARFWTKSGLLNAGQKDGLIELDFPAKPTVPCEKIKELEESLGTEVLSLSHCGNLFLAELESASIIRKIKPDFKKLESLKAVIFGVIVTAASDDSTYDFISRFFAPAAGIPEDPVTGSAHCCLAPFWKSRLLKNTFSAFQASTRGGVLKIRCEGDRVFLGGKALTITRRELSVN